MQEWVYDNCKTCGSEFKKSNKRQQYCSKVCGVKFRSATYYAKNQGALLLKRMEYNSYTERRILARIKSRAKRNNIPFDLELVDIVIPEYCPVLGIKIKSEVGCGANPIHSPSVDRVDPTKGYTKGNVRVISNRANLLKSNASVCELALVLEDLRRLFNARMDI